MSWQTYALIGVFILSCIMAFRSVPKNVTGWPEDDSDKDPIARSYPGLSAPRRK